MRHLPKGCFTDGSGKFFLYQFIRHQIVATISAHSIGREIGIPRKRNRRTVNEELHGEIRHFSVHLLPYDTPLPSQHIGAPRFQRTAPLLVDPPQTFPTARPRGLQHTMRRYIDELADFLQGAQLLGHNKRTRQQAIVSQIFKHLDGEPAMGQFPQSGHIHRYFPLRMLVPFVEQRPIPPPRYQHIILRLVAAPFLERSPFHRDS